jgi:hypothetical protein
VVAVLMLLSAVSWWYYPRGDTRFVGKWGLWESGTAFPAEFYANGIMKLSGRSDFRNGHWTPWKVKGSSIAMGYGLGGFCSEIISEGSHALTLRSPVLRSPGKVQFRLVDADLIEVRLDGGQDFTLRRIPE